MSRIAAFGLLLALTSAAVRAQSPDTKSNLRVRLADARLRVGSESFAPVRVLSPAVRELCIGARLICVGRNAIFAIGRGPSEAAWTAKIDDGQFVRHVTGDGDRAYVLTYEETEDGGFKRYDPEVQVRVLDVAHGRWLRALRPTPAEGAAKPQRVTAVEAAGGQVAMISLWGPTQGDDAATAFTHYQVDTFAVGGEVALWTRRFAIPDVVERDGTFEWGLSEPREWESQLRPLGWLDDALLVCAHSRRPLHLLSRSSGRTIWELERPWEYERGFIGPSMSRYFVSRFGLDDVDAAQLGVARKAFDERWSASIVGGPIIVPLPAARERDRWTAGYDAYSIFVAVEKSPAGRGEVRDCVVYEFNERAIPVSIARIPQVLNGRANPLAEGGVYWRGENGAIVRIAAAELRDDWQGWDCTSRVEWFRQVGVPRRKAWCSTGIAVGAVAFGEPFAFSVNEGGFVPDRGVGVYTFPIVATAMKDGQDLPLELDVPFDGEFRVPEPALTGEAGAIVARYPHLLAITALDWHGNALRVTLAREHGRSLFRVHADLLEFDLSSVRRFVPIAPHDAAGERRRAAEQRVRGIADVNARGDRSYPPLFEAASEADTAYLEALLVAGANPKLRTETGWTALLNAAGYGGAEAVDILIRAGSELNARDGNCGGNPVLTWACGSGRDPAKKARALLDAGADVTLSSERGWTPLMAAASRGRLTCVELLLQRGAPVDAVTMDGRTAMNAARDGGYSEIVAILEAAARR